MGKKLDLTKLSDDEAKHVWEVVQRDISLRRKEEERLEDLKFKVEKESAKREILSGQSRLNNTHCLHCLNPFQFLLNSKRQCQDCKFYVCKNCSRYNKKEQGWVCDTCRATRMVKIGSLEWYYDHVRSRFKRFGSAKVMRHLYTRLQPDARGGTNLTGLSDRVYSLPDISREYLRQARSGMFHDDDEDIVDSAEAQRYSMMRKTKRLLSVHPFDFEIDSEYSAQSRRQSMQLSPTLEQDVFQSFSEYTSTGKDAPQKDSLIAEAELASMFHHLLQEQDQNMAPPEQEFSTEVRLTVNRRRSLENTRRPSSPSLLPKGSQYSGDMDSSDEERGAIHKVPPRRRSRASSQENVHHSGTQISELNKRMSTIERMLNRLEERISVASDESTGPGFHTDADIEEETLKRKLGELASNISDKGGSSDDEKILKSKQMSRSYNVRNPDPSQKVYMAAEKAYGLENNLKDLEERACQSTTDSELSEIEVSVASAMAQVQQAESEVSDIESRIAALSAAGLTVSPSEKAKRKSSPQTSVTAISRSTEPFMPSSPELYNLNSTPSEAKILSMQDALRKKFNIDSQLSDGVFERNALYRGSLTQRNPNGKNKKVDRMFAKPPILTQR
ncbi:melanophilin isoform X1 [Pelobates cultripes]|uniref:Melanophilin isoform X1 n=1 Tax=Pelobates cultripes TaxID=61616 RepID=A0AAD1SP54_PELCU|nr:melanophilin isoform X1 [Pelobates cultripes]CAH2306252.1 melanophilin isoform X1 [Pelobates cultripes]